MSRLAFVADFEREIREVEALIAEQRTLSEVHGFDFTTQLTLESLEARKSNLLRQLHEIGDSGLPGHELSVVLRGAPVDGARIEVGFLGSLLKDLQNIMLALVNAQFGRFTREGPWPADIKRRATLRFAETFAGSFGMRLEAVDEQLELQGNLVIQPAFEDLFDALTSDETPALFLENLAPLGPRARSHLRTFLEHVSSADVDVDFRWPLVEGEKRARLNRRQAQRLAKTLRNIDERTRLETMIGVLEGAVMRTRFFELELANGDVVGGRISADIQQRIEQFFNQQVSAEVLVTTVTDKGTGEEKTIYTLLELNPPPDIAEVQR